MALLRNGYVAAQLMFLSPIVYYFVHMTHLQMAGALAEGLMLGLFMAVSVGPTLFAVLKYSLEYGHLAGIAFVLGVSCSDLIYVTIANCAVSWLHVLARFKMPISLGGGIILVVAGIVGLFSRPKPSLAADGQLRFSGKHFRSIWLAGFLVNSINPGVIISWLTAVTATSGKDSAYRFVLFATCLVLVLSIDFLKVFLASRIKQRLTRRFTYLLQKAASAILVVLGMALGVSGFFAAP
jgi:threonine/homoserine/homoserine lactone efflux protein